MQFGLEESLTICVLCLRFYESFVLVIGLSTEDPKLHRTRHKRALITAKLGATLPVLRDLFPKQIVPADFWCCAVFVDAVGIFSTKISHYQKLLSKALCAKQINHSYISIRKS